MPNRIHFSIIFCKLVAKGWLHGFKPHITRHHNLLILGFCGKKNVRPYYVAVFRIKKNTIFIISNY